MEMKKCGYKIACVVVTFNRKELLVDCLNAILLQTYKPQKVYIIDNASVDGTYEYLKQMQWIDINRNGIFYKYVKLPNNIGGAGGFYSGMKMAYESNEEFDAIWVMDDDGMPQERCLENLVAHIGQSAYLAPLVLSMDNHEETAFQYIPEKTHKEVLLKYGDTGIIQNYANPFNGILYRKDLLSKIGFPKKEMFIWGDESEFHWRAKKNGFIPVTILSAIHYHPKDRLVMYKDFLGRKRIVYVDSKLRRYCAYRNTAYKIKKYLGLKNIGIYFISNIVFYLIQRRLDISGLVFFITAARDGLREDFSRHYKYLNK